MSTDVAVVEDVWGEPFDRLAASWTVHRDPEAWQQPDRLRAAVGGARALVVRNRTAVTRELLRSAPGLQLVARAGVGLDNIDLAAAEELGVVVTAARGANARSVAEHAIGLALALSRHVVQLDGEVRQGRWDRRAGRELAGRTWGLLSAGATARATARLAVALGMQVLAHDPFVAPDDAELAEIGVRVAALEEVVSAADVLSVHLPLNDATRGLVDAHLLQRMPPGALLVNVGRGEVVDEADLADALESGHLGGAALDVRATEPPVGGRLEKLPNVVLTPHVAGITVESQQRIAEALCTDIDAVLSGAAARHAVTRDATPRRATAEQDTPA